MSTIPHHQEQITSPAVSRSVAIWQWLWRAVPTVTVVAVLGGLAAWGHLNEWKMPKLSALVGTEEAAEEVWCEEHSVAEAECIECKPALLPPGPDYGWCKVHGVGQCPLEHPEVAQVKTLPKFTQEDFDRASRALAVKPRVENNSLCTMHTKRVQFASIEAIEKAGVDVAVVLERPVVEAIEANGEVVYDQNHLAHLSSRVPGTVWRVDKRVGDRVVKGECLALIDAAEIGKAKSELLTAISQVRLKEAHLQRVQPLSEGVLPVRQLHEAETALQEARIRLQSAQQSLVNLGLPVHASEFDRLDTDEIASRIHFLGLPEELMSGLDAAKTTASLFPIRSQQDGVVIERHTVVGETVDANDELFSVVDASRMWLMLNVREDDAKYVAMGQSVLFRSTSSRDEAEIRGLVAWISTSTDDQTRTVQVRVELPNADGRLRANTFGHGRIVLREEPRAVVVPSEAVHGDGNCSIVFVRDKQFHEAGRPKFFYVRTVRLGVKEAGRTEIIAGLVPGEIVAGKNSVVLESQLLKANLGAGCCEVK